MHNVETVFDIGASLAAAREAQGLGLGDVERLTCLRQRYLVALEDNDFDALPGRAYARAFLRTYSDALGLDADRFVDEFDETMPAPVEDDLVIELPRVERPLRVRLLAAVTLGAAGIVAVLAWAAFSPGSSAPQPPPAKAAAPPSHPRHHVLAAHHVTTPKRRQPLLIHAVDGSCWLLVRKGGATGPVLYEGTIAPGQSVHFAARVWVRLGAPWNVTVRRGSQTFPAPSGNEPQDLVA